MALIRPVPVTLPAYWVEGRALGEERQATLDANNKSAQRLFRAKGKPAHENIMGAVGETVISRWTGLPMQRRWVGNGRGDPGWDFHAAIGRIDVKTVASEPWYLAVNDVNLAKRPGADLYAFIWAPEDQPTCQLIGFATRAEVEAGTPCAQVLDATNLQRWRADPRNREKPDDPGRYLYVADDPRGPGLLHDAAVLLDAIRRGQPASLWLCPDCLGVSVFSALRPVCDLCDRRMVEANTWARAGQTARR